ncbi:MAG: bacillithiol system redox-active protein YtxJ [Pyrinomonadaceae bacterium]
MDVKFETISDMKALEDSLERSHVAPVVLFKHSTTCPISSAAYREMSKFNAAPVALVVVQTARPVSNEIASRTGIAHASPQAIVVRNGEAVWSATHYDITADAVTRAVEAHAAGRSAAQG